MESGNGYTRYSMKLDPILKMVKEKKISDGFSLPTAISLNFSAVIK